jgi:hypothetical protein
MGFRRRSKPAEDAPDATGRVIRTGLVDEPAIPGDVPARPGGVDQLRATMSWLASTCRVRLGLVCAVGV